MKGRTFASKAGLPPAGASKATMALSYGYVCRPLPSMGPSPVARTVKVGMGSAEVVSVVEATAVVVMSSLVTEVVDVSRAVEESVASTDESAAAVEVTEATDVAVSIDVADSIDDTNDVSVDASEVAVVTAETKSGVNNLPLKLSIKCR